MSRFHKEYHKGDRIGWLRAAVLGANDGVISVASLVVGVASAGVAKSGILLAGLSGLIAGMMSMAAGEYVSVKSQADTETAEIAKEKAELETQPELELEELTAIYMDRGLDEHLARQVAEHLTVNDAIGAHSRDELGITETLCGSTLSSITCFSILVRRRCSNSSLGNRCRPAITRNGDRGHIGLGLTYPSGRNRRLRWRSTGRTRNHASYVLGTDRYGIYLAARKFVRNADLILSHLAGLRRGLCLTLGSMSESGGPG